MFRVLMFWCEIVSRTCPAISPHRVRIISLEIISSFHQLGDVGQRGVIFLLFNLAQQETAILVSGGCQSQSQLILILILMIFTLRDEVEIYHTVLCCVLLVLSLHITLSLHWYYDGVMACLCQVQLLRTNLCVCRVPGSTLHTPPLVGPSQHNFYGQKAGWGCSALAGWSRTDAVDVSLGAGQLVGAVGGSLYRRPAARWWDYTPGVLK